MAQVILQQAGMSYDGRQQVIHGIDLTIDSGELMAFVGPSGCGKSSLLRLIAGLEPVGSGELFIDGRRANDVPAAQRELAMVFQSYALYPHMSVFDNMAFALKLAGQPKPEVRAAVERAAAILQIDHLLARKPKDLSGGQRQRVAIGRAIVRQPKLFLFDEPLSNLDASLRVQMRVEISRLHRELKTTMIYVTHDQVEAMTLGQRIAVFNGGRIEQVGTPYELYTNPANLFVAGFLGTPAMNFLAGQVVEASAASIAVALPGGATIVASADGSGARAGDPVTLGIRAEHIVCGAAAGPANALEVEVGHVEYLGDQSILYTALPGGAGTLAVRQLQGTPVQLAGARLRVALPAEHCLFFNSSGKAFSRRTSA